MKSISDLFLHDADWRSISIALIEELSRCISWILLCSNRFCEQSIQSKKMNTHEQSLYLS